MNNLNFSEYVGIRLQHRSGNVEAPATVAPPSRPHLQQQQQHSQPQSQSQPQTRWLSSPSSQPQQRHQQQQQKLVKQSSGAQNRRTSPVSSAPGTAKKSALDAAFDETHIHHLVRRLRELSVHLSVFFYSVLKRAFFCYLIFFVVHKFV